MEMRHEDTEPLAVRGDSMPAADDAPDGFDYGPHDQLRHDLKTPLTLIAARAYLLARSIRRSSSLTDGERGTMLDGVAAIEEAVRTMVITIDGIGGSGGAAPQRDTFDGDTAPL
jgi:hypothetical protein